MIKLYVEEAKPKYSVRVMQDSNVIIMLIVDEHGDSVEEGMIGILSSNGLHLCSHINPEVAKLAGLSIDDVGHIKSI